MKKNIQDMLYTISARLSHEEYAMREELNLKKRILNVFTYAKEHQNLLYDRKIITFFDNCKAGTLTRKNLKDAEKIIKDYKDRFASRVFALIGKKECTIPYDEEERITEYCNDLSLSLKCIHESLNSLKILMEKENLEEEVFSLENIELFHAINLANLEREERELLISLYKKWASEIDSEYKFIKKIRSGVQTIGTLLSIKDYKSGNYSKSYEDSILSEDVHETANYIRNLIRLGEYDLANQLMQNNREALLVRIAYDIEGELMLLEKENVSSDEEETLISEMKKELVLEKETITKMVGGVKQWQK